MGSSAQAPIDLAFDSDEEAGPVRAGIAPSSSPRKIPVPLPLNLPRPSSSSAVQPQAPAASVSGFQPPSGRPRTSFPNSEHNLRHANLYDMPPNPQHATSSQPLNVPGYIPLFAAATPGEKASDFSNPQAGKRRKITGPPPGSEHYLPAGSRWKSVPKEQFYGVKVGHVPGVYTSYDAVKAQTVGCKGAKQQRFDTKEEAQAFVDGLPSPNPRFAGHRRWPSLLSNGGASLVPNPTNRDGGESAPFATHPTPGLYPVGGQPLPAAKLNASGLPSVPSLNTALKAPVPFIKQLEPSQLRRELQLRRLSNVTPSNRATEPASNGVASGYSMADEMVIDQDDSLPPRQRTIGQPYAEQAIFSGKALEPKNDVSAGNSPVIEDPLETLLEDDIISGLLQQLPANDKVALLMKAHPRGQRIALTMQQFPAQVNPARTKQHLTIEPTSTRKPRGRPPLRRAQSSSPAWSSERDSVLSGSEKPVTSKAVQTHSLVGDLSAGHRVVATVEKPSASMKWTGGLSEAEAHLLIFLKEVKKLSWPEITARFQEHYPDRKYGTLQTNYSQKINRRDRSQDPTTLILPSMYASGAHVDWAAVHANSSRPNIKSRRKPEIADSQEESRHGAWSAAFNSVQDQSSGAESTGRRRGRPRRAVPVQNYTWPKRNTQIERGSFEGDESNPAESAEERPAVSETPEDLVPAPEKAIAVENEPLLVDFDMDDAFSALAVQNCEASPEQLPYLSSSQRSVVHNVPRGYEWDQLVSRDWQGTLIHVDLSPIELNTVESTITRLLGPQRDIRSRSQRKRLRRVLNGMTEPKLLQLADVLRSKLPARDRRSIDAFLRDAQENKIRSAAPRIERLAASRPNKSFNSEARLSTSSVIRRRELGLQSNRGWSSATPPISYQLKNKAQDTLGPVSSYTGASSDVHAVAWSVDGECFAAGAICVDDPHSMQYNRSNNLLYGDVSRNTITELGKHYVERPRTEAGPNSTHAMYASQDPKLFKTVTTVAFSPNGKYMYSGGWDHNVWVWETKYDGSQPTDAVSLHHKSEVSMMAVNASGVLATGTRKSTGKAVKVLKLCEDDLTQPPVTLSFVSEKAAARPDLMMLPMALHFSPRYENLLLAGFGANARHDGRDVNGDICLWDINTSKQLNIWGAGKNVFDLSFHPRERCIAVASVAGQKTNRGMRSTVRVYSEQGGAADDKFSTLMELECRALDINDVVWCPGDDFLVAAGCTSGRAYVWDIRNPNHFLRELAHGSPLMPLDDREDREVVDTGIRFLSWGTNATRLYSGSSDGVVKVWNVARSEGETFVKDLITVDSGIMSGAFSPDYSRLVLGEVNGSVNVLEVGRDDCSFKDAARMRYIPFAEDDANFEMQPSTTTSAAADSGVASAKELLETGQMIIKSMGGLPIKQAVQGSSYAGPYDASVDAPFLREQALELQLKFPEPSDSPCSACLGSGSDPFKITSEEIGDSGRSVDRIPDELRSQWLAGTVDLKIPHTKVPCGWCGRAARPSDRVDPSDGAPLPPRCERCEFVCLRCGGNKTDLNMELTKYSCQTCILTWDIGLLGYDLSGDSDRPGYRICNDIPTLDGYKKDLYLAKLEAGSPMGDEDATFGDDMNALTDYYFSLAIDRPESPPL
ncbi:hypothetical protein PMIN07_010675 [Paraphaeosphaeria minitans]